LREDDPGSNHCGRANCVGWIPSDHRHRAVFVCIAKPKGAIRKNHSGVGTGGDGGVSGDFEGAHELAEGLFAATTSGEAFEGGDSDSGEKAHNANDGEEFDEGEGRWLTPRTPSPDAGTGRRRGSEREDSIWECEMRNLEFEKGKG